MEFFYSLRTARIVAGLPGTMAAICGATSDGLSSNEPTVDYTTFVDFLTGMSSTLICTTASSALLALFSSSDGFETTCSPFGDSEKWKLEEIPIKATEPSHPVPRSGKSENWLQELMDHIKNNGIDTGRAVRLPDGRIIVSGGHHRRAAMEALGEKTMPFKVVDWADMSDDQRQGYMNMFSEIYEEYGK